MLGRHIYTAAMAIAADRDMLFNEVYDAEHIPALEQVPGVIRVRRFRRLDPPERFYLAVYEIEHLGVPLSLPWLEARDLGRWPTKVRPFTSGLQNGLFTWAAGFGAERLAASAPTLLAAVRCPDAPDLEARSERILASLSAQAAVVAAAFYREHEGRPHLFVAAIVLAGETAPVDAGRVVPGVASLGRVEIYASTGAWEG
jgi:hypothetical protein